MTCWNKVFTQTVLVSVWLWHKGSNSPTFSSSRNYCSGHWSVAAAPCQRFPRAPSAVLPAVAAHWESGKSKPSPAWHPRVGFWRQVSNMQTSWGLPALTFDSGPAASPLTGLMAVLCFCLWEESRAGPCSSCFLLLMGTRKSNLTSFSWLVMGEEEQMFTEGLKRALQG